MSPGLPSYEDYGNSEQCTVSVNVEGYHTAVDFQTEKGFDFLVVEGYTYSGTYGPRGAFVPAGATVVWHTDGDLVDVGWKLCWSADHTKPGTLEPLHNASAGQSYRLETLTLSGNYMTGPLDNLAHFHSLKTLLLNRCKPMQCCLELRSA